MIRKLSLFFLLIFVFAINATILVAKPIDSIEIASLLRTGKKYHYIKPDSANYFYNEALLLSRKHKNQPLEVQSLIAIAKYLNYTENFPKAVEKSIQAINLAKIINYTEGEAKAYQFLAFSHSYLNSLDKSIEYYLKSLELYTKINNQIGIADSYSGLGNINYEQKNYRKAIGYFLRAVEILEKTQDKEGLLSIYINIGNAYADSGSIDKGLTFYSKSIDLGIELQDYEGVAINFLNISDCYIVTNNSKKATIYLTKAKDLIEKGNYVSLNSTLFNMLAKVSLMENNYSQAIKYSKLSAESAKHLSWLQPKHDSYKILATAYEKIGNYKEALYYSKLFKEVSDSIYDLKKNQQVAHLDKLYSIEKQEEKIKELTEKNQLSKLKLTNQKIIGISLLVLIGLLIFVIYLENKQKKVKTKLVNLLTVQKEKAEESDRLKSAFLANMSHEIRTPLNGILGFTEMLSDPELPPEKRGKFVDIILNSGKRLLNTINDIVDMAKIESNQLKIQLKKVEITHILQEVVSVQNNTNNLLKKKQLNLYLKKPFFSDEVFVTTDSDRVVQILDNLINNAVKFTNEGFIEVGFYPKNYANQSYLEFYVKDSGVGIPKEKFKTIFERFGQVGDDKYVDGNGLGLSIIKGIVALLQGETWLESSVGKGSTFYFTIPYLP